jgi:acyl-CoA synthetase (AMP-forming)/AMP-acid ligase II
LREEVDIDDSANFFHYAEKPCARQKTSSGIPTMKAESTRFFDLLRRHAREQPDAIASRSSRRTVTYRKFWSRIERATARLIGEWQVQPGDIIAYWGCGHQDALMLYLAVARCGARLLPLEHASLRQAAPAFFEKNRIKVLLHDDDLFFELASSADTVTDLSSLIATRCHHHPVVTEDESRPSLIMPSPAEGGALVCSERSLASLQEADAAPSSFHVTHALFGTDVLAERVLPVLAARGTVVFR